jgi:hypothetical protein
MQKPYLVYTGEETEFYETLEEAEAAAKAAIEFWREIGLREGEWPEEVYSVYWGKAIGRAKMVGNDAVLVEVC